MRKNTEKVSIKGFFRVQIQDKESGKIVGDTGYIQNQVTNYGMLNCLVGTPANAVAASSVQIAGAMLGSGGDAIAATAVALASSLGSAWYSTLGATVNGSTQAQFTQTFSNDTAVTIGNIGLLAATDGSLIAGKSYASSALATTQSVNMTYNLNYTTS